MKPEELLNSLDHIGEDLLSEAEQNVLVRTKRPWIKTAVAAVLVAAVGIGGFLTLKHFSMRDSTQAAQPDVTDPVTENETLPMLIVGDSWNLLPGQLTYLFGDGPSLCDPAITRLPVYSNQTTRTSTISMITYYSQEQITSILEKTAQRLGLEMTGPIEYTEDGPVFRADVETPIGTLAAFGDGEIVLYFSGSQAFDDSSEDLVPLNGAGFSAAAKNLTSRDRNLLGLSENDYVLYDSEYWTLHIFPAADDPVEQLLVRSFGSVRQSYSSSGTGDNLFCNQRPGSESWYDVEQDWRVLIGNYPILSLAEAKDQVLEGHYYCLYGAESCLTEDMLSDAALVYQTDASYYCLMPFYRFVIQHDDSSVIISVPAVRPEYLIDFPETKPRDDEVTETDPAITENHPVLVTENGQYLVRGAAGSVEALHYMGIPEQEQIYADVDFDGQKELVYLFNGPTSGLHTVGLGVYGLQDGLPVLKASEMFLLSGYDLQLELDKDTETVWSLIVPVFPTPEGTETVRTRLQVEGGSIQLLGAMLPDGCQRWRPDPTEADIAALESQLPDGYYSKLCVNDHVFFSDTHTRIWQQDDDILKKNLSTGETETLFSLEPNAEIETSLLGVTENRLYFGWNETGNWWGVYVYSVDYHGEDRVEIATEPQEVSFERAWISMVSFHTDVRQYTLKVIDRSDKTVVDVKECWANCVGMEDDALYYIYVPALQDWDEFGMENSERDALVQHVQYAVCRVDVDRSVTTLGVIDQDYDSWNDYHGNFPSIDADHQEIIFYNEKAATITRLDLSTMQMKAKTVWSIGEQTISHLIEDYVNLEFAAVPYLNADTSGADSINAEIREKFDYLKKDLISSRERPAYHVCYEVYLWKNVVSIIIKTHTDSDFTDYAVYCYDNFTGLRLDTAALLKKMGISQDDFLEACKVRFVQKFEEDNAYMDEQTREASGYEKELARQKEYVNMELMVYPNQEGQLVAIAPIATFAGAGYCYTPLVLDLGNAN